jgi:hypothetical protein
MGVWVPVWRTRLSDTETGQNLVRLQTLKTVAHHKLRQMIYCCWTKTIGPLWPESSGAVSMSKWFQDGLLIPYWSRAIQEGTHIMYICKQQTEVTHHIIPWWWRQSSPLKCWTTVPFWWGWTPEKILLHLVNSYYDILHFHKAAKIELNTSINSET